MRVRAGRRASGVGGEALRISSGWRKRFPYRAAPTVTERVGYLDQDEAAGRRVSWKSVAWAGVEQAQARLAGGTEQAWRLRATLPIEQT